MPEKTNYWDKFSKRKFSRRRLLTTTALVGTGLGAAAVVGCRSDNSGSGNEPTPELLTYIVKLHKGVKFHDSDQIRGNFPSLAGRELTADDVIYSYERQRDPNSYQRTYYYRSSQYATIDSMQKVDDYTIKIKTTEPTAPFYHFMADTNAMIIPKEIVDMQPGPDGKRAWDSVNAFGPRNLPP